MKLSNVEYLKYIWVSPVPKEIPSPSWVIPFPVKLIINEDSSHVVTGADGNEVTLRGWQVMEKVTKIESPKTEEKLIISS